MPIESNTKKESDGPAVASIKDHLDEVRKGVARCLSGHKREHDAMIKALGKAHRQLGTEARMLEKYQESGLNAIDAFRVNMSGEQDAEPALVEAGWIDVIEFGHKFYWSLKVGDRLKVGR